MIEQYLSFSLITILGQKFLKIFFHTLYNVFAYYSTLVSTASACYFILNYVLHWHLDLKFLQPVYSNIFHTFGDYNIATKNFSYYFMLLQRICILYLCQSVTSICILFHAYLDFTYIYIFHNCMTSLLLFKDAMAEPLHHVVTNASSLCCSFEHLQINLICALTEAAKSS